MNNKVQNSIPKPAPASGGKLSSSAMAIQAAKLQKKKKNEEEAMKDKNKMTFISLQTSKLANSLLQSKTGKQLVEQIEQQGDAGVEIAESLRIKSEKYKLYKASKVDVGEQKRLALLAITARFNEGLPISNGGTGELHDAIRNNLNNRVRQLLSHSNNVDEMDSKTGYTPLIVAAKEQNKAGAKLLLAAGAETRYQNRRGATALHFACKKGNAGIVRLILHRAYETRCVAQLVQIKDTDGRSARDIAQGRGETQLVSKIDSAVKEEAAVKAVEDMLDTIYTEAEEMYTSHGFRNGSTALHWVLENGNMEFFSASKRQLAAKTIFKLIELGADVNDIDSAGRKPLHYAAMSSAGSNTACARALLRCCKGLNSGSGGGRDDGGSNSSEDENDEDESIDEAKNEIEVSPSVVQIDALDGMGMTPMFYAVERGEVDFCALLLKFGANVHFILNPSGFSYLHICAQRNFGEGCNETAGEIGEWLIDNDVDHNVVDDYGRTAKVSH
jgi:ankyrin repeat protein